MKTDAGLLSDARRPIVYAFLLALPMPMFVAALVAYVSYQIGGDLFWLRTGLAASVGGVALAFAPMAFGASMLAPAVSKMNREARAVAIGHLLLGLAAVAVFGGSAWAYLRIWTGSVAANPGPGIVLSIVGIGLAIGAGWMMWSLIPDRAEAAVSQAEAREPASVRREERAA
jgi:uncharacterized membrane protein